MPSRSVPRKFTAEVDPGSIHIEVVYALPERTRVVRLTLPAGSTAGAALERVAASEEFAAVNLEAASVGIFGRVVSREQPLKSGDRLEIYRSLAADPKTARRKRLASKSGRS
jgi:putative ubiquitin-RnfH superfamily antitoxin RatB of RatAB toxin-antitoxin module